jgi:hypothetical protein
MRKLQAQAAQLAAAGWPGQHPGPPMPAPKGSMPVGGQMPLGGQLPSEKEIQSVGQMSSTGQMPTGGQMPTKGQMPMPADSIQKDQPPMSAASADTAKSEDSSHETDSVQPPAAAPTSQPEEVNIILCVVWKVFTDYELVY